MYLINEAANILCFPIRECCPPKVMTTYTLPFKQIELNGRINFKLPCPNKIHYDRIDDYRRTLDPNNQIDQLKDRLYSEIEMIKMEELIQGVALCCQKVNELINSTYALGVAKNKSQTFVAELALPFLKHRPQETFSVSTDKEGSRQSMLIPYVTDYLVFDDASYSGHQLRELICGFGIACNEFTFRNHRLFLVVPFVSTVALEVFEQIKEEGYSGLEIHLITTTKRIKAIRDKFNKDEILFLDNWLNTIFRPHNLCLTLTEWKMPDVASVPGKVTSPDYPQSKTQFVTSYPEVYKI